jgi:hypothetical protein
MNEQITKSIGKLKKSGLLVDVINADGVNTMVTPKGYEQWEILNLFISSNETDVKIKPKKSGQEKMDSAIKTVVQVGAGISQLMQGLGKMAGDPVKMDMSQAGINFGQTKPKKRKKKAKRRKQ